ncbi:hypothetical protein V6833_004738 [Escherichia coli]
MRDLTNTDTQPSCDHTAGIQFFEKFPDLMPGKLFFSCDRLSAHITFETCRQNYEAAQQRMGDETPLRLMKCRGCSVGRALHAGVDDPASWMDVRSSNECLRCGRRDLRVIAITSCCVSCWNREREGKIGKDARGNVPRTRVVLNPRRVGLLVDGKPTWRVFAAYHEGEAVSRAIRQVDGAKFHDQQPGKVVFNARTKTFQYRCKKHGGELSTLAELQRSDGRVEYVCPVCQPGRAKSLPEARVCSTTAIQPREFVREIMRAYYDEPVESWKATEYVCDRCEHYALQVRTIGKKLQCRCPLCDAAE